MERASSSSSSLHGGRHQRSSSDASRGRDWTPAGKAGPTAAAEEGCVVREQDRFMPIANVIRIMRKILPSHAKISDDAKETIQECVSEYISFVTSEANERCQREQRKTITADDVLWAMRKLGFDDYVQPLTVYLHKFREAEGDRAVPFRMPSHRNDLVGPPPPNVSHHHPTHGGIYIGGGFYKNAGGGGGPPGPTGGSLY